MGRIAYVNGLYRHHAEAVVHIEDRGYQFADGVYEVWAVRGGRLCDHADHMARLSRSLKALRIRPPMSDEALDIVLGEVRRRNHLRNGLLYLQITRGAAPRDHAFPPAGIAPSLVITAKRLDPGLNAAQAEKGGSVITLPETRWARCDIKSISLLPNVLAKQAAREAGAIEAWFVDRDGFITEGAASTAFIVDSRGWLRTRSLAANILPGVTRASLLRLCEEHQILVSEEPFTPDEVASAREAFISGAGALVQPVIRMDGHVVGDGKPGPLTRRLRALYLETQGLETLGLETPCLETLAQRPERQVNQILNKRK